MTGYLDVVDPDADAHAPRRRSLASDVAWMVPILIVACALGLLIYLEPDWGANASAALSFVVSVVGVIVSILIERGYFTVTRFSIGRFRGWQRKVVAASISTFMIFGLGWWFFTREQDPFDYLSDEVLIGYTNQNYPGWHTRATNIPNSDNGFDVAVATALQQKFYEATFKWVPLSGLGERERRLINSDGSAKSIKLVISNFSITPERQASIDFAGPYFRDVQGLLTRTGEKSPSGTDSQVCTLQSSTGDKTILGMGWTAVPMDTLENCLVAYRNGAVAGVSTDLSILALKVKASALDGVVVDLDAIGTERYGIGIPNNRPRLCAAINEALDDFLTNSWGGAFDTFIGPAGVGQANRNPRRTAPCEQAGPSFVKD